MCPLCCWRWSFLPFKAVKDAAVPCCQSFPQSPILCVLGHCVSSLYFHGLQGGLPSFPQHSLQAFAALLCLVSFSLCSEISGNEDPCFLENNFDLDEPWSDPTVFLLPFTWGKPPHYHSWCLQHAWNRAWWVRTWIRHWSPMPCFKSHVTTY